MAWDSARPKAERNPKTSLQAHHKHAIASLDVVRLLSKIESICLIIGGEIFYEIFTTHISFYEEGGGAELRRYKSFSLLVSVDAICAYEMCPSDTRSLH